MNQPKKTVLRLLDIVPDRVYFLPKTLEPVKIVCTDASGWQRGRVRVDLEIDQCPISAYALMLSGAREHRRLEIARWRNEFYFCTRSGYATLLDRECLDLEYQKLRLGTEQFHLQNRLAEVTAQLKILESL